MKTFPILCVVAVFCTLSASAQFRGTEPRPPSTSEGMVKQPSSPQLFGFLNPDKFSMSHSVSMSYLSMGREGLGVTMYINHMRYQLFDPLTVSADVSMMFTPFGSMSRSMQDISGIYLNNARIDYQPSKDFRITLQYNNVPFGYYGYGGGLYGGRMMFSPLDGDLR